MKWLNECGYIIDSPSTLENDSLRIKEQNPALSSVKNLVMWKVVYGIVSIQCTLIRFNIISIYLNIISQAATSLTKAMQLSMCS